MEGGRESAVAGAARDVVGVELQEGIKASRLSAPAPTNKAEPRRKLLRLTEDPKFNSVPMKDLLKNSRRWTNKFSRKRLLCSSAEENINTALCQGGPEISN